MRPITPLALTAILLLAGCAQEARLLELPEGADTVVDATGKTIVDDAPSDETVRTDSGRHVAVNKALLHGRVHDDFNFSLEGAFVSIIGTAAFTQTNATGHYVLENVTVGTFDVRVEMDQFRAKEVRVTFETGQDVRLDVELLPLVPRSGGFNPHVHDFWGSAPTRIIMDATLSVNEDPVPSGTRGQTPGPVAAVTCGVGSCGAGFVLPEQEDGAPATIWPGTKEIRVTLTWAGPVEVQSLHLDYTDPSPAAGSTPSIASGDTATITVAKEMQDHGHAQWSGWRFTAVITNAPTSPSFVMGDLHVKLELVKGDVVLDPPHPDFWKGRSQMPIGSYDYTYFPNTGVLPTAADSMALHHVFNLQPCLKPKDDEPPTDCVSIIPPGTARIEIRFEWLPNAQGRAPFDYSLKYRSADQDPHTTEASGFRTPTVVEQDLAADWRLYEVELEPEQADGFYMQRSDWAFKWYQDTGLPYNVLQNQYHFHIQVTAFKEG